MMSRQPPFISTVVAALPVTWVRIGNLVWKEFIQLRRDWLMTVFILTLPVFQLVLMAQSTGSRISDMCVAVLDLDHSADSRRLTIALDNRDELRVCRFPGTMVEMRQALDRGEAVAAVVIQPGFAAGRADGTMTAFVQIVVDGSSSVPARYAQGAAQAAVTGFVADLLAPGTAAPPPVVDLRTTVRFNPRLDVQFYTVSAQVGFIVYQVTLVIAAIALARERELGTLEQLVVMPVRRFELVTGKVVPALVIGSINFGIMLTVAVRGFGLPMRGSLPLLIGLTVLFILTEVGYGILISILARTQQQAILFVFVLAMVDMAFSGYLVRVENLPLGLQAVAQIIPFHHYLVIIRGVMLKGIGLDALWPHAAAIVGMGGLITMLAIRSLGRSLD